MKKLITDNELEKVEVLISGDNNEVKIFQEYSIDNGKKSVIYLDREQRMKLIEALTEKVYEVQSYLVKFDMGNPVDVNINVYHTDQTELTREEIIEEALGYAEELNIELDEKDICEIETLEMKEKK